MISKISLFNKGIYKSTVRRYTWGSVLYFILLFLCTGMVVLLDVNKDYYYLPSREERWSLILSNQYIILPLLLAMVVPTVVGLMIFRFIHSKKTSVFVHSLPVKREANFISSVLAGITLMSVPIILNAAVLIIISLSGYSAYFTVGECVIWMLINLFALFVMFSCTCFVATLTGNSFAMIALNILFHFIALIFAACFSVIAETFLYGFANENALINKVLEHIFPVKIIAEVTKWTHGGFESKAFIVEFIAAAFIFYLLGAVLYKIRRMETAEDVAAFKCLNPIFKYMLTFIAAIIVFSIFSYSTRQNQLVFWLIILLASAVIYFASEMLLKKTLRVWHSYKGFIGFSLVFAIMMCTFAFTSFFGFETYIPKEKDVVKVALYDFYHNEKPYIENSDVLAKAVTIHADTINRRDELIRNQAENYFHIEYELKGGKTVHRRYGVSEERFFEIMNSMYENDAFKMTNEEIFDDMESVYAMHIYGNNVEKDISIENKNELIECIKKDIKALSYSQIESLGWGFTVSVEYVVPQTITEAMLIEYPTSTIPEGKRIGYASYHINPNYKNTVSWIKENGYWDSVDIDNHGTIYVCRDYDELPFVDDAGRRLSVVNAEKEKNVIKIEDETQKQRLIDYIVSSPKDYIKKSDRYYVYQVRDLSKMDYRQLSVITKEEVENLLFE